MSNIVIPTTAEEVDYDNIGEGENFLLEPIDSEIDFRIIRPFTYRGQISFEHVIRLVPGYRVMNEVKDVGFDMSKMILPLKKVGGIIVQEPQSGVYFSLGNGKGGGYREDDENSILTKGRPLDNMSPDAVIAVSHFSHYPIAIRCIESTTKFYSVSPEEMEQVLNNLKYLRKFLFSLNAQVVNLTKEAYSNAFEEVNTGDALAKTFYKSRGSN